MSWLDVDELLGLLKTEEVLASHLAEGDIMAYEGEAFHVTVVEPPCVLVLEGGAGRMELDPNQRVHRVVRSCLRLPPVAKSWANFEEKIEALEALAIKAREVRTQGRGGVEGIKAAKDLQERVSGHCWRCCMPVGDKHPPHDPEFREGDIITRLEAPSCNTPEWKVYIRAKREQYQRGLRSLTDEEIMTMPLPVNMLYAFTLMDELTTRIRTRIPPKSRWDRLRGVEVGYDQ